MTKYLALFYLLVMCFSIQDQTLDTNNIQIFQLTNNSRNYIRPLRCQGFKVNSSSQPFIINIESQTRASILITQKILSQCDSSIFQKCNTSSKLCIESQMQGLASYSINKCLKVFYVYIYLQTYNGGFISSEQNSNGICQNGTSPTPTPYANVTCTNYPLYQCAAKSNTCDQRCYRLDCVYKTAKNRRQQTVQYCVDRTISPGDWDSICESDYGFQNSKEKKVIGHYCNKQSVTIDFSDKNQSEGFFWDFISWVFWLSVITFIGSIIFYRYRINKTGVAPFNPPLWVPDIFYPRQTVNVQGDPLQNYREI